MPVDFSKRVAAPILRAFGENMTVDPVKSQPGQDAYAATGVFGDPHFAVTDEEVDISSSAPVVFIRLADFDVPPAKGDTITRAKDSKQYRVADVQKDGEGGADLPLSKL